MDRQEPEEYLGERRTSKRFRIQAPAVATVGNQEIWAFTRNISTHALYLITGGDEQKPSIGERLDFLIKIPPSLSFSKPCFIKGCGRTIRIDDLEGNETGVVVEILAYDIESGAAAHPDADDVTRFGF